LSVFELALVVFEFGEHLGGVLPKLGGRPKRDGSERRRREGPGAEVELAGEGMRERAGNGQRRSAWDARSS
jgi:hypothetical protein